MGALLCASVKMLFVLRRSSVGNVRGVTILTTEFFEGSLGGFGGYGWLARRAAQVLGRTDRRTRISFSSGFRPGPNGLTEASLDGWPVRFGTGSGLRDRLRIARLRPDALLSIDHHAGYLPAYRALPGTPAIVWLQDPRADAHWRHISTLRVPGTNERPAGITPGDASSLVGVIRRSQRRDRTLRCASPSTTVAERALALFGDVVEISGSLPYPMPAVRRELAVADRPLVLFLGRLDPIKRPWVVFEVARRMPAVDFAIAGNLGVRGAGAWTPSAVPPNVKLVGHVDGREKDRLLQSAWVLVNTSIHEALPVSFCEALAYQVPIVSAVDPDAVCTRFGRKVAMAPGDGLGMVDDLVLGIQQLIDDEDERARLGAEGCQWVTREHGEEAFLRAFDLLLHRTAAGTRSSP